MPSTFDTIRVNGDINYTGRLKPGVNPALDLLQRALSPFTIDFTRLRKWDEFHTNLPGTAATDDLALIGTTFGTGSLKVSAGDLKNAGATTRYARFMKELPENYEAGETITLRFYAGMETTVASVSASLDVEAFFTNYEGVVSGSDLCTTAAQSINSLVFADKDFTITPTGLVAGDWLDIRIAVAVNDSATATAVDAAIGRIQLLCDTRG
jgi:hypothetical protein